MEKIKIINGDITKTECDAIVNAANTSLLGGGGVDGAIHRAAGPQLLEECRIIGGCPTGEARLTKGYNLKAGFVIHTAGPVWNGGQNNEDKLLTLCYTNCLNIALKNNFKTIAFPNISTGIYGFPKLRAAEIAIKTVVDFINNNPAPEEIFFVCFDNENFNVYKNLLKLNYTK